MESRLFIKAATALVQRIKDYDLMSTFRSAEEDQAEGDAIQKQINTVYTGLQNPTLPSAYKLRDAALECNFTIAPAVLQRIAQAETIW